MDGPRLVDPLRQSGEFIFVEIAFVIFPLDSFKGWKNPKILPHRFQVPYHVLSWCRHFLSQSIQIAHKCMFPAYFMTSEIPFNVVFDMITSPLFFTATVNPS